MTATFVRASGFTLYYCVQRSNSPRYPYGVCGPFATEAEAATALERIAKAFPATACRIELAGFTGNDSQTLTTDNARARQRLEKLRA